MKKKCNRDLNQRPEILKLPEEDIREKLLDISIGNDCMNITPEAQVMKTEIDKWDNIKLKCFCTAKEKKTTK